MDINKIREALNAAHGYIEYQYRRALEASEQRAIDGTRLDLDNINEALAELDKAQQPGKMLTVDEVMEAIEDDIGSEGMERLFRARLTAALEAKTRTA